MSLGAARRAAPAAALLVLALPATAAAHGIVGRADLPIPAELFGAAAAAVLVVSFVALATGWSEPRLERPRERALLRLPVAVDVVAGALGVLAFAVVVYAGLAGADSERDNLAPTAVYVVFWVGIPAVSLVLGDVFRLLSPWRAIGRATGWAARRLGGEALPEPLPYQGQDAVRLASDPLGGGADLFGTADRAVDYGVVSATAIWYVQVAALVAGHVAALVLGHDRALAIYGSARAAARSQIVMVCFTCLGLYLLSAANA